MHTDLSIQSFYVCLGVSAGCGVDTQLVGEAWPKSWPVSGISLAPLCPVLAVIKKSLIKARLLSQQSISDLSPVLFSEGLDPSFLVHEPESVQEPTSDPGVSCTQQSQLPEILPQPVILAWNP